MGNLTVNKEEEFKKKVTKFIEEKYYNGKVLSIEKSKIFETKYHIKFTIGSGVWFQPFKQQFNIDSIDFDKRTISAIVFDTSNFNID